MEASVIDDSQPIEDLLIHQSETVQLTEPAEVFTYTHENGLTISATIEDMGRCAILGSLAPEARAEIARAYIMGRKIQAEEPEETEVEEETENQNDNAEQKIEAKQVEKEPINNQDEKAQPKLETPSPEQLQPSKISKQESDSPKSIPTSARDTGKNTTVVTSETTAETTAPLPQEGIVTGEIIQSSKPSSLPGKVTPEGISKNSLRAEPNETTPSITTTTKKPASPRDTIKLVPELPEAGADTDIHITEARHTQEELVIPDEHLDESFSLQEDEVLTINSKDVPDGSHINSRAESDSQYEEVDVGAEEALYVLNQSVSEENQDGLPNIIQEQFAVPEAVNMTFEVKPIDIKMAVAGTDEDLQTKLIAVLENYDSADTKEITEAVDSIASITAEIKIVADEELPDKKIELRETIRRALDIMDIDYDEDTIEKFISSILLEGVELSDDLEDDGNQDPGTHEKKLASYLIIRNLSLMLDKTSRYIGLGRFALVAQNALAA